MRAARRDEPSKAHSSARLINSLLELRPGPHRYLEIGVAQGHTFREVRAEILVAVDPFPDEFLLPDGAVLHRMTSRQYFDGRSPRDEGPFTVVFVDGMHLWAEAGADVVASFQHLRSDGFVVVDDVFPSGHWEGLPAADYSAAVRAASQAGYRLEMWMGDVWRVVRSIASAKVPGLRWMTVRVSGSRYHTVYWRDEGTEVSAALSTVLARAARRDRPSSRRLRRSRFSKGLPRWYHEGGFEELLDRVAGGAGRR